MSHLSITTLRHSNAVTHAALVEIAAAANKSPDSSKLKVLVSTSCTDLNAHVITGEIRFGLTTRLPVQGSIGCMEVFSYEGKCFVFFMTLDLVAFIVEVKADDSGLSFVPTSCGEMKKIQGKRRDPHILSSIKVDGSLIVVQIFGGTLNCLSVKHSVDAKYCKNRQVNGLFALDDFMVSGLSRLKDFAFVKTKPDRHRFVCVHDEPIALAPDSEAKTAEQTRSPPSVLAGFSAVSLMEICPMGKIVNHLSQQTFPPAVFTNVRAFSKYPRFRGCFLTLGSECIVFHTKTSVSKLELCGGDEEGRKICGLELVEHENTFKLYLTDEFGFLRKVSLNSSERLEILVFANVGGSGESIVHIPGTDCLFIGCSTADSVLCRVDDERNEFHELDRLICLGPIVDMVCVSYGMRTMFVSCSNYGIGGSIGFTTLPAHRINVRTVANLPNVRGLWPFTWNGSQYVLLSTVLESAVIRVDKDLIEEAKFEILSPVPTVLAFAINHLFVHVSRTALRLSNLEQDQSWISWNPNIGDGEIVNASRDGTTIVLLTSENVLCLLRVSAHHQENPLEVVGRLSLNSDDVLDVAIGAGFVVLIRANDEHIVYDDILCANTLNRLEGGSQQIELEKFERVVNLVVLSDSDSATKFIFSTTHGRVAHRSPSQGQYRFVEANAHGYAVGLKHSPESGLVFLCSDSEEPLGIDLFMRLEKGKLVFERLWIVITDETGKSVPQKYTSISSLQHSSNNHHLHQLIMCTRDGLIVGELENQTECHSRKIYLGETPLKLAYHSTTKSFVVSVRHRSALCAAANPDNYLIGSHSVNCRSYHENRANATKYHSSLLVVGWQKIEQCFGLSHKVDFSCICTITNRNQEFIVAGISDSRPANAPQKLVSEVLLIGMSRSKLGMIEMKLVERGFFPNGVPTCMCQIEPKNQSSVSECIIFKVGDSIDPISIPRTPETLPESGLGSLPKNAWFLTKSQDLKSLPNDFSFFHEFQALVKKQRNESKSFVAGVVDNGVFMFKISAVDSAMTIEDIPCRLNCNQALAMGIKQLSGDRGLLLVGDVLNSVTLYKTIFERSDFLNDHEVILDGGEQSECRLEGNRIARERKWLFAFDLFGKSDEKVLIADSERDLVLVAYTKLSGNQNKDRQFKTESSIHIGDLINVFASIVEPSERSTRSGQRSGCECRIAGTVSGAILQLKELNNEQFHYLREFEKTVVSKLKTQCGKFVNCGEFGDVGLQIGLHPFNNIFELRASNQLGGRQSEKVFVDCDFVSVFMELPVQLRKKLVGSISDELNDHFASARKFNRCEHK